MRSVLRASRALARIGARLDHRVAQRLVYAEPLVSNRLRNPMLLEHLAQHVMTPIEVTRQDRDLGVRVRQRAPFVSAGPAEETRGEPELVLDQLLFVFPREEKAHHRVVEELVVERAKDATQTLFAADLLIERGRHQLVPSRRLGSSPS